MKDNDNYVISPREKELLDIIQDGFPIVDRPFKVLGEKINMSERDVIENIFTLTDNGIIRIFGPVFDPGRLGYVSTLGAAQVEEDRLAEVAAALLDITEITHNYVRDNEFNMWFTVTAHTQAIKSRIISFVKRLPGVGKAVDFPTVTRYKIRAVFGTDTASGLDQTGLTKPVFLEDEDIELIRHIQRSFPVVERPFHLLSETLNCDEMQIRDTIITWLDNGTIRRFGARLNHRRSGFRHNCMVVWKGDDIDTWGREFARIPQVSHCYRRKTTSGWPYELYTMVHCRTADELTGMIDEMSSFAPGAEYLLLNSLYELKKTTMRYFEEEDRWDSQNEE